MNCSLPIMMKMFLLTRPGLEVSRSKVRHISRGPSCSMRLTGVGGKGIGVGGRKDGVVSPEVVSTTCVGVERSS